MARYADLDRDRLEHIAITQSTLFLAIEALAYSTGQSTEFWVRELKNRVARRVGGYSEAELEAVCAYLDSLYN